MFDVKVLKDFVATNLPKISAETVGWFSVLFLHAATIPSLLSLIAGVSNNLPSMDIVLFVWTGLVLMFVKALIQKDVLNLLTIGVGFMIQAGLLGFLVFK